MSAQFGDPADWEEEPGGYLARLLARAEIWSKGRFGATAYIAVPAGSPTFEYLRNAEICWTSGKLWKARAGFIDSNAASSREGMAYLDRREYEESARRSFECAEENIALAIGDGANPMGTGVALTHVETGPFAGAYPGAKQCPG